MPPAPVMLRAHHPGIPSALNEYRRSSSSPAVCYDRPQALAGVAAVVPVGGVERPVEPRMGGDEQP